MSCFWPSVCNSQGRKIALKLASGPKDVEVTLAKYNVPGKIIATNRPEAVGGLRVDYTSILIQPTWAGIRAFDYVPDGVVIREVQPAIAAAAVKLEVDAVITRVNDRPVNTPAEFYRAMHDGGRQVRLTTLISGGQTKTVTLEIP